MSPPASPPPVVRSLSLLYPPFLAAMQTGLARARAAGVELGLFETYRSPQRQDWLYAQGRTKPGKIVTRAQGWQSWHQFGVAADIAVLRDGKWSWDFYPESMTRYFEGLPVAWGGKDDGPHYQYAKLPTIALAEAIVRSQGHLRLWQELEAMT